MKSRNQTGSAHVVIMIILVILILGALGFVFWNNFINKKGSSASKSVSTSSVGQSTTRSNSSLDLTEFGVKIPYDPSTDALTLKENIASDDTIYYAIYSPKASDACKSTSSANSSIGNVSRYVAADQAPQDGSGTNKTWAQYYANLPNVTIGQYIYVLGGPQEGCADDSTTEGAAADQAQEDAYNAVKTDFLQLTQN